MKNLENYYNQLNELIDNIKEEIREAQDNCATDEEYLDIQDWRKVFTDRLVGLKF